MCLLTPLGRLEVCVSACGCLLLQTFEDSVSDGDVARHTSFALGATDPPCNFKLHQLRAGYVLGHSEEQAKSFGPNSWPALCAVVQGAAILAACKHLQA